MSHALVQRIQNLPPDERAMVEMLIERLDSGRKLYGPWRVDDQRDNLKEALEEALDLSNYLAAELVRLRRLAATPEGRHAG